MTESQRQKTVHVHTAHNSQNCNSIESILYSCVSSATFAEEETDDEDDIANAMGNDNK